MRRLTHAFAMTLFLAMSGCASQMQAMRDEIYIPQVSMHDGNKQHYLDDAQMCREKVIKDYKKKLDSRNINTDFRTCLIDKGYMLLS